ncbi:hypothetical protein [Ruminiclostridium cellobioparum]|uniref:hypothetical protein n=1 Tax=Ruminiclostridium cellobioparum TaxID=29355 RepID=UPI0028A66DB6|nr:hypothetical protein [Ruminiclostridium cellobioparum]
MRNVDRLIIKAKNKRGETAYMLSMAFIQCGKQYTALCDLWNGKPGSGVKRIESEHQTLDQAIKAIHALAEQYPNEDDVVIIVDDIEEGGQIGKEAQESEAEYS